MAVSPKVDVPTMEQFNSLEQRVAKLEEHVYAPGPKPPEIESNAQPISRLIEMFGVNTFSSLDEHNLWGSWPADYRPGEVIKALKYILSDSEFCFGIREYHYAARIDMQREWFDQIMKEFPDGKNAICVAANGSANDVNSMVQLYNEGAIDYIEGLNEPNTDFGSGEVKVDVTMAIQSKLWDSDGRPVAVGPSVVAGTPRPQGWITGYFGDQMNAVNGMMKYCNAHYYPPGAPAVPNTGYSCLDYVSGLMEVYNDHPCMVTEWHPTLYNMEGNGTADDDWSGERDAYYNLTALLEFARMGVPMVYWYALFDYGTTYKCGLFPTNADNPRPAATTLKYLVDLVKSNTDDKYATPPTLNINSTGHDTWSLYGNDQGEHFLFLWKAAKDIGGEYTKVMIELEEPKMMIEYDLVRMNKVQEVQGNTWITCNLDNTVRMIKIS